MAIERRLEETLGEILDWNWARIKFLAGFMLAIVKVQTVNLTKIANVFVSKGGKETNYKRIQRFLRGFEIEYNKLAVSLVKLLPLKGALILTMDRTNWQLGKCDLNILRLGVAYQGIAWPIMWLILEKKGNSNTEERKQLINMFVKVFGAKKIKYLTADREFIGEKWTQWLKSKGIDFRLRIKANTIVNTAEGCQHAYEIFKDLPIQQGLVLPKPVTLWNQKLWLSGCPLEDDEYLIIITPKYCSDPLNDDSFRGEIETLFGCLKSRGFNLEDTQLTQPDRLKSLIALLALTFCWVHLTGNWLVSHTQ